MDSSGFIVPPPNLIPPREDTGTETRRAPARSGKLPVFRPPTAPDVMVGAQSREPRWRLVLPTGRFIPLDGTVLVGRNPVGFGPWGEAELITVDDPASSVSKTHAAFEPSSGSVRVTDVHSTNGIVVVAPGGAETELVPGIPADAANGAVVRLGRLVVRVERV
ncbi:FHA domain-containing protein [Leifsonia poae]|uniref:FHA domain-containing protein n=1 Tax=Leifsonia poae TaxID=110933 RepID=UPI001CC00E0F|nr:FHA domain-containing protein [Leifsonia poae]